jgi:MFS family permease
VGYVVAVHVEPGTVLTAGVLTGLGQSALHATLQRWATEAAPTARGLSTSLFATGAFVGAGLAALLPSHYSLLFAIAAVTAVVTAVVGASARLPKVARTTPPA